ncbi:MAG: protein kinase [Tannerellaceae bacterium]|nr:protein kinase [Tannerellaceae bacterium]
MGEYTVEWLVWKDPTAELYHVKNDKGKNYFLKLFTGNKEENTAEGKNDFVQENEIRKQIAHPNLCRYRTEGEVQVKGEVRKYILFDFVSGETLSCQLARKQQYTISEATHLVIGILNGLKHLHSLHPPVLHKGLSPDAVMISLLGQVPVPKITDLSYAGVAENKLHLCLEEKRNPLYMATETFSGLFTVQSDLYAVGVIFYQLLTGQLPWDIEQEAGQERGEICDKLYFRRQKNIYIPTSDSFQPDEQLIRILQKALHEEREYRFSSAEEFIRALHGELYVEEVPDIQRYPPSFG